MGDHHDRLAPRLVNAQEFRAHALARQSVQGRKGLV